MITASHNPQDYNGMKLVRKGSRPISGDTGLRELEERVVAENFTPHIVPAEQRGKITPVDTMPDYVEHVYLH